MRKIINYGSQTILKKDLLAVNKTHKFIYYSRIRKFSV